MEFVGSIVVWGKGVLNFLGNFKTEPEIEMQVAAEFK